MNDPRLLIAEDDPNLGQILKEYLSHKGFEPTLCIDGELALRKFYEESFDLCVFDLMMPKKDGFTLATEVRQVNSDIPIIFLTAKSMKEDVLKGFKIGADDYITKPFSMEELLHRIHAVLRRTGTKQQNKGVLPKEFKVGNSQYFYDQNKLVIGQQEIKLTTKENELLKLFFETLNETVDRSYALNRIWKDDSYFNARSMDVYIAKLRKHLSGDPTLDLKTVHGEGFKLVVV